MLGGSPKIPKENNNNPNLCVWAFLGFFQRYLKLIKNLFGSATLYFCCMYLLYTAFFCNVQCSIWIRSIIKKGTFEYLFHKSDAVQSMQNYLNPSLLSGTKNISTVASPGFANKVYF
jgi:hypothetical protein